MVRHTTTDDAKVSTPDYRADVDLAEVDEGDRVTFTTRTNRTNGVPLTKSKTLTVDDVTVEERETTEMFEVEPAWFPEDSRFGGDPDRVESASVPRTVTERRVEVVAIDENGDRDAYRYTLTQSGDDVVRVSSCKQTDFERQANGVRNAVADSNVSHGYVTSWEHTPAVTDGGTDTVAEVDAHDLSEGDRVEIEATPMKKDEPGTVAGEVTDATVHTMNGDEVGQTVKVRADTGTLYVRNGAGTLSVVDDDGFHVTIAWGSTLRRVAATDGGDDIIVAGDEGVVLTDDEDDGHDAHPDDEGVEILTDGGEERCPYCKRVNPDVYGHDRECPKSRKRIRTDGGKPPGEDVSVAPNYDKGGVWFTLGDLPRRLLSPDDARAVADHVEDAFGPTPPGYDDVGDMATQLRRLADEVETKVDDPDPESFDDIPLTD